MINPMKRFAQVHRQCTCRFVIFITNHVTTDGQPQWLFQYS